MHQGIIRTICTIELVHPFIQCIVIRHLWQLIAFPIQCSKCHPFKLLCPLITAHRQLCNVPLDACLCCYRSQAIVAAVGGHDMVGQSKYLSQCLLISVPNVSLIDGFDNLQFTGSYPYQTQSTVDRWHPMSTLTNSRPGFSRLSHDRIHVANVC